METATIDTIRTRYGTFAVDRIQDKKIAKALQSNTYPNEILLEMTRHFVNTESTVIDIGAHIGTFAIPLATCVKKIIAFEPSPGHFTLLSRNADANGIHLQLINKALGSVEGRGALIVRNASNAGTTTLVAGDTTTISTLDAEVTHADFIKLDVEGMELEVLRGGVKLIERARPVILFEVHLSQLRAHGVSPRALEEFLTERGYRLYLPLENKNGALARVRSITLLTTFIAPRAWFCFSDSAPFDLVAVPQERVLPCPAYGFTTALFDALKNNLAVKMRRLRALVH